MTHADGSASALLIRSSPQEVHDEFRHLLAAERARQATAPDHLEGGGADVA
jgi:hypothetical protein